MTGYQWFADDVAIDGAVGNSYEISEDDLNKEISLQYNYTDNAGNDHSVFSNKTASVIAAPIIINGHTIEPHADLSGADLSGADLSGADLTGASLATADLSNVNLSGADLTTAHLSNVNLSGANLTNANIREAFLEDADLTGSTLINVNFSDAELVNADLRGSVIDDVAFSGGLKESERKGTLSRIFCNGRHVNLSVIVTAQKHSQLSTTMRSNASGAILFNNSMNEVEAMAQDFNYLDSKKEFVKLFREATKGRNQFLVVNFTEDAIYQNSEFKPL